MADLPPVMMALSDATHFAIPAAPEIAGYSTLPSRSLQVLFRNDVGDGNGAS
jgi:hypothetical protein